jgi:hypothetical protein
MGLFISPVLLRICNLEFHKGLFIFIQKFHQKKAWNGVANDQGGFV